MYHVSTKRRFNPSVNESNLDLDMARRVLCVEMLLQTSLEEQVLRLVFEPEMNERYHVIYFLNYVT